MTTPEEYRQYLVQQIKKVGMISAERDEDGAVISDTVPIWIETELEFIEITDVYIRNGNIYIKGFNDRGSTLENLPVIEELDRIEEFISMNILDYVEFKSSPDARKSDIIDGFHKYCANFKVQITLFLDSIGNSRFTSNGKTLFIEDGKAVLEYPDKKRTTDLNAIILFLYEIENL